MEILNVLKSIREEYSQHASDVNSLAMQTYMKDKFIFFGIKKPIRKEILKPYLTQLKNISQEDQIKGVKWLWKQKEREMHYLAFELLFRNKKIWDKNILELFEELIVSNSWWDSVDYIASTLVGYYFQKFPERKRKKTMEWMKSKNMWLNRTAMIFQLKYRDKTDVDLLFMSILPHLESKEFFHQKAIGWALRQYAYTDMKTVKKFVESHSLKPLSVREALRHA
ncbi:MAG: DNA alkylation repair protein [Bacteroidia bacterium]